MNLTSLKSERHQNVSKPNSKIPENYSFENLKFPTSQSVKNLSHLFYHHFSSPHVFQSEVTFPINTITECDPPQQFP